ncbi:PBP1A family penicillin-binding protein [Bradyrhizobium sp.]|uniref:PBP1A family penicillin-binding protein n=1 Tax=Bradyrhizobium sp. TaxID=376 RepID=UPI0025BEB46B|nr:PBP1A family penicillin-binding protein [Bradyrhizobium sp.]
MTSSPDQQKIEPPIDPVSALNDAPVTPAHVRDSFRTLAGQIAVLAGSVFREAACRAQVWWSGGRTALRATGASFGSRWPGLKADLVSSTSNARWPRLDLKSRWQGWRSRSGAAAPKSREGLDRVKLRWKYLAASLALALALLVMVVLYSLATLPVAGGLQVEATQSALTFEGAQGEVFAARGVFKGDKLTAADLPPHLAQAIVAIEDRRFYQHIGVDFRGIMRAGWRNTQAGGTREGGSTITQQLARLMFLSPERSFRRKVQEALLALWLESQLTKEDILLRYLNTAYFGAGAYGVDAAARRYFGKKAGELSLAESAMLAGLVRAPSQLAPTRNFGGAKERQETVLQTMVETKALTEAEAETARAQPVNLRTPPETPPGTNYFIDMVAGDVRRLLGSASGDLTLRTTLNLELQRLAEGVIERRFEAEGAKKNVSQAALVALGRDGAVLAMVGGRNYEASQFNRATQAKRQAGSLFKLFVYLTALQRGYTPQSVVVDKPTQIGEWEPQNYSGRFRGSMTLRNAFAQSVNTIAAQLGDEVGTAAVIDTAKRMGVQSTLPAVPSLALGSAEVTLLEMTRAFGAVAAGVQSIEPYSVRSIAGNSQQALYTKPGDGKEVTGQLGASRAMMSDLLQSVVNEGTGKAARIPNVLVGGKTGTTQEYRDAWFIGFTPDIVVGVWVGNDDNTPTNRVTGGDLPASIWRDFVGRALPAVSRTSPQVARRNTDALNPGNALTPASPAVNPPPGEAAADAGARGSPEVVDLATLAIRGRRIQLQGILGEDDRRAVRALARFLRRREVICEPSGMPDRYRCNVDGQDLSRIILSNGGARATPDAPAELLAAEDEARSARVGIWRNM